MEEILCLLVIFIFLDVCGERTFCLSYRNNGIYDFVFWTEI